MKANISVEDLVEIDFNEPDDFLKIKETLTRIGVSSRKEKKLFQSCHILHKRGRYYIVHFKELFALDGLHSDIDDNDIARRNKIIKLLEEWGLLDIIDKEKVKEPICEINQLKILSYKDKGDWELCPKYHIGRK
tara:strand:- start:296 stop:697 length:402 start_codon:yes stop_codon:yes gene_type:complete